jgi:hypothetical protein
LHKLNSMFFIIVISLLAGGLAMLAEHRVNQVKDKHLKDDTEDCWHQ